MTTIQDWLTYHLVERETPVKSFYYDGRLIHVTTAYSRGLQGRVNSGRFEVDGVHVYWDNGRTASVIPMSTEVSFHEDVIRTVGYKRSLRHSQIRLRKQGMLAHLTPREAITLFGSAERKPFSVLDCKIVSNVEAVDVSLRGDGSSISYIVSYLNGYPQDIIDDPRGFTAIGPYLYATGKKEAGRVELQV